MQIDHISTTIQNNKLKFLTRIVKNETTRRIVLTDLNEGCKQPCYISDCYILANKNGIDFLSLILNVRHQKIVSVLDPVPEDTYNLLVDCLSFWHIKEKRNEFSLVMEERIPLPHI